MEAVMEKTKAPTHQTFVTRRSLWGRLFELKEMTGQSNSKIMAGIGEKLYREKDTLTLVNEFGKGFKFYRKKNGTLEEYEDFDFEIHKEQIDARIKKNANTIVIINTKRLQKVAHVFNMFDPVAKSDVFDAAMNLAIAEGWEWDEDEDGFE